MKLYDLLLLLYATIEHVTTLKFVRNSIQINNRNVYELRIYRSMNAVEVQFAKKYGSDEKDYPIESVEKMNIEVVLDSHAKQEIIMVSLEDGDIDEITI